MNKYLGKIKLFFFIIINVITQKNISCQPLIYKAGDGFRSIIPNSVYLIDSTNALTFNQIRKLPITYFIKNNKNTFDFGPSNKAGWFVTEIENKVGEDLFYVSDYVVEVDFYFVCKTGKILQKKGGFARKFGSTDFETTPPTFKIGQESGTLYVRIFNPNLNFRSTVSTLAPIIKRFHKYDTFFGGLLGLMIALAFYNLFLFFSTNDKLHLYYFGYILASIYVNAHMQGIIHEFFGNNIIFARETAMKGFVLFFFLILFSTNFLNTANLTPKLHKVFYLLLFLLFMGGLTDFLPNEPWMSFFTQSIILLTTIYILFISIYIWRLGYEPAKYFAIAFIFYFAGVIIFLMGLLQIFFTLFNSIVAYSYAIGCMIEALMLSFAIGHRMSIFKTQAHDAQKLALKRAHENEILYNKNNELISEKLANKTKDLPEFFMSLQQAKLKKISVPTIEGILYFPLEDVVRLEAFGSYCTIYLIESKKIVASRPMAFFETMLDENLFLRIHKSHIVNLQKVIKYIRGEGGFVKMTDINEVPVSRSMKAILLEKLKLQY